MVIYSLITIFALQLIALVYYGFKTKVLPTFHTDKALNIDKLWFDDYVKANNITSYDILIKWLKNKITFFHENGFRLSD